MTPSELMALAAKLDRGEVDYHGEQAAALRSYAELCAALLWLKERGWWLAHYGPDEAVAYAESVGWPGLEEA